MFQRCKSSQPKLTERLFASLLAAWIFVLTLAGVSPEIHEWLHADEGCASHCEHPEENETDENSGHYCGVLILQSGATITPTLDLPERLSLFIAIVPLGDEAFASSKVELAEHARAPPVKVIA